MTAEQIQLFLKPGGNELERPRRIGDVVVKESMRTVIGPHLTYTPADRDLRDDRRAGGGRGEEDRNGVSSELRDRR